MVLILEDSLLPWINIVQSKQLSVFSSICCLQSSDLQPHTMTQCRSDYNSIHITESINNCVPYFTAFWALIHNLQRQSANPLKQLKNPDLVQIQKSPSQHVHMHAKRNICMLSTMLNNTQFNVRIRLTWMLQDKEKGRKCQY